MDDLIEHAECYMPPAKIDGTPPTPIDDDPESEESMEDLMYHADQYFQPGDDIEYYDPHHDWYIQNLEGEDIPSTFALNDEDDKRRNLHGNKVRYWELSTLQSPFEQYGLIL